MTGSPPPPRIVTVTGANGLVGARTCVHLLEQSATVRALVRRPGTAPAGTEEVVGDLGDPRVLERALAGAQGVVTTVHPMRAGRATQHSVGVEGTTQVARAAQAAGVSRLVHVSTAAVYDRAPDTDDVDESSPLVGDDAGDYPVTKRDADASLDHVEGITRILVRPPAILGSSENSVWNTLRPAGIKAGEPARAVPDSTFAWVHVDDLAALLADAATGRTAASDDPAAGPIEGACTPVNVAGEPATQRDYYATVCAALGVEPVWLEEPGWKGGYRTDRANGWGWQPSVDLRAALAELERDVQRLG